tara:strand:+ start:31666 stop:31992 length:327 start_codon:yes stop_codon:yes gene_type:complete
MNTITKITLALVASAGLASCASDTETVTAYDGTEIHRVYEQTNEFEVRKDIFRDPISGERFECAWLGKDNSRPMEPSDVKYNTLGSVTVDDVLRIDRDSIGTCLDYKI